jgi:hypothetical protein
MFEIHFNELLILSKHLNHLVRSVVNGATTYYPSASYKEEGEKPLPVFDHPPQIRFGFGEGWGGAGGQKVAERQSTGDSSTLSWLIPDQLGSTNVTANADGRGGCTPEPRGGERGTLQSEMRYTGDHLPALPRSRVNRRGGEGMIRTFVAYS